MPQAGTATVWKWAAVVHESLHTTLPNNRVSQSRHCRVAVNCPCPATEAATPLLIGIGETHATHLLQGCVQMRARLGVLASAQTSHDCQGLVCVWWRPWVSRRAVPRAQYYSLLVLLYWQQRGSRRKQGMVAGICPVGSTGTKLSGHIVSTA